MGISNAITHLGNMAQMTPKTATMAMTWRSRLVRPKLFMPKPVGWIDTISEPAEGEIFDVFDELVKRGE